MTGNSGIRGACASLPRTKAFGVEGWKRFCFASINRRHDDEEVSQSLSWTKDFSSLPLGLSP